MNGSIRSCFKLCSNSILSNLKQNTQPEMAKRLYSTFWRTITGPKPILVNNFKSILDRSFSSSSAQFSTEMTYIFSPIEKQLLEHVEQEIAQPQGEQKADSEVCGFEKKVDKSDLIFSKSLPNEKILVSFNTNHYVKAEDYKEPIGNETDGEPFEHKINPNFRVEIQRKNNATLGFECILTQNRTDENHVQECPDTSMFIIRNYAFNKGQLNENNYQCCGVGNVRDAALYNIMKNLLREKGICDEFLSAVIFHSKIHETDNHSCFIKNLKKFIKGETGWDPSEININSYLNWCISLLLIFMICDNHWNLAGWEC
ncbi:uncharacterized protein LOC135842886 isoform X2 [Planococcus citri]|uniref:uncharacterized protein LOC135842886 isoform X2 n=1 Tax=Planococcus citri TaxID=170843 RepID=UPI0031F91A7C